MIGLTEQELVICRATGAKWVTRDDDPLGLVSIYISEERPPLGTKGAYVGTGKLGIMDARAFPSLERGACVKVPLMAPDCHKTWPLTMEELEKMDGMPVYVVGSTGSGWCIVDWHGVNRSWMYFSKTGTAEGMSAKAVFAKDYGEEWVAYRRPPEGHEEPEEDCCPVCGAEIEYDGDQEIVDDGTVVSFTCPKCGATGKASYNLVFDNYYDVQKGE